MIPGEVITIDGPAGSGKSTISRALARILGFLYLDTGAMYRSVALAARRYGVGKDDRDGLSKLCKCLPLSFDTSRIPPVILLGGEDISAAIRSPEMDLLSSDISAVPEVREALRDLQRKIALGRDVVAEGRDMGTVVFPSARHKFFLTAAPEIRAQRRYAERLLRGESTDKDTVVRQLVQRDRQDETRQIAPLRPAREALIIDTTSMTIDEVLDEITSKLRDRGLGIPRVGAK